MRHWERAAVGATAVVVVSTFLPWGQTGRRVRSSHELVDVADRAGVVPDWAEPVARMWLFVPLLAGVALIALGLARHRIAGIALGTLGSLVATGGLLTHRAPIEVRFGATIGLLAGLAACFIGTAIALHTEDTTE